MLGKSAMKWRQRPDMAIAVDWDVKHQLKQIINQNLKFQDSSHLQLLCKLVSIGPDLRGLSYTSMSGQGYIIFIIRILFF